MLEALVGSRIFVPVVAVLDESELGDDGLRHEKHSSMATVLVQSRDGGRALLAFSGIEPLTRWQADARPVPLAAPLAARAAVDEGADALLIDVAGPVPFAVAGHELLMVAAVTRHPGGADGDPVLREALKRHLALVRQITSASLTAGAPTPTSAPHEQAEAEPAGVLTLVVSDDDRSWLADFAGQIANDRVVARLLPQGLRVRAVTHGTDQTEGADGTEQDTPSPLPKSTPGL